LRKAKKAIIALCLTVQVIKDMLDTVLHASDYLIYTGPTLSDGFASILVSHALVEGIGPLEPAEVSEIYSFL